MINELIEQIGGRARLEEIRAFTHTNGIEHCNRQEWQLMARALLAVLNAKPAGVTISPTLAAMDEVSLVGIDVYTTPPAASVPDGWKIVPVEPTPEMLEEIWLDERFQERAMKARYAAMLAAAPAPGGDGG